MSATEIVYDAGMLIAIDDRDGKAIERHLYFLSHNIRIVVPAIAAARAVRNPSRQARLMLALRGSRVEPFTKAHYARVGRLLADSGTCDVVDAFVALTAARLEAGIYTSDGDDMRHLFDTLGADVPVHAV
jgi:predicted nucleic acid-binding protein